MLSPPMSNGTIENFIALLPFFTVVFLPVMGVISNHPAARLQILTGHPACSIARKKGSHVGHFLGRTHALEGRQVRSVSAILLEEHIRIGICDEMTQNACRPFVARRNNGAGWEACYSIFGGFAYYYSELQ